MTKIIQPTQTAHTFLKKLLCMGNLSLTCKTFIEKPALSPNQLPVSLILGLYKTKKGWKQIFE